MHSPFVFDFILNVLNNKGGYDPPPVIELARKRFLADKRTVQVKDLGAGSRVSPGKVNTVKAIAVHALKPEKYACLLYRLIKHYQPMNIIELGTSLGITTAYLSFANPGAAVTTIEGSEEIAALAEENLHALQCNNVKIVRGNFNTSLPEVLEAMTIVDFAYIDGNHRYEPTIQYFHALLEKTNPDSILVFDDIHWSAEMEKAWREIKAHPAVKYTIDIFFLGFVFFKREFRVKQDYIIKF